MQQMSIAISTDLHREADDREEQEHLEVDR